MSNIGSSSHMSRSSLFQQTDLDPTTEFHTILDSAMFETDEFRMYGCKVARCRQSGSHSWISCPYLHQGERARRRDPRDYNYAAIHCSKYRYGGCWRGDACAFAHGVFEYWLHPAKYRTRMCNAGRFCSRNVCFFAHSLEELRPETKYFWYFVEGPGPWQRELHLQPYTDMGIGKGDYYSPTARIVIHLGP